MTEPSARRLSPSSIVALTATLALVLLVVAWWVRTGDPATDPGSSSSPAATAGETPTSPPAEMTSHAPPSAIPASPSAIPAPPSDLPTAPTGADGIPPCDLDDLPATVLPVVDDILAGGPFEHPRHDGGRFGNFEGILPEVYLGYYREYTVETPGLDHRGARRIVTGGSQARDPDAWYYTADHYDSFCQFVP